MVQMVFRDALVFVLSAETCADVSGTCSPFYEDTLDRQQSESKRGKNRYLCKDLQGL